MTEEELFDQLRKHYELQLPFVTYRKPETKKVHAVLQQKPELFTTEDFSESGFVFAPFNTQGKAVLFPENASEKLMAEQVVYQDVSAGATSAKEEISKEKRLFHIDLVRKAISALQAGKLEKVVLSRREELTLEKPDFFNLFQDLLNSYPTAFVYCWYHPEVGCWLGATPETLLKIEGNRFKTMALAGTQKFTGSVDAEWGEKERQEQQFVTDSIAENLKYAGVENLEVSAPFTARAGNLLHIRTDIEGKIPDSGTAVNNRGQKALEIIIHSLHPTPAVCGLPREKAQQFILCEEGYDREFYTGFLGELNLQKNVQRSRNRRNVENLAYRAVTKKTELYVNLRCMKIEAEKAVLFVGGGITKDSIPEAEWEETVNKAQTIKKVLLK